MGPVDPDDPAAKGPATECLDALSVAPDARDRLRALVAALLEIQAASFSGLEDVLARHLLSVLYNAEQSARIAEDLRATWFSETGWWPTFQPIAPIYGLGLLQTVRASLSSSGPPIPIDSYWMLGHTSVELITLVNPRQVTLMIATPTPPQPPRAGRLGHPCEVWVTCRRAGRVAYEIDPRTGERIAGTNDLRVRTFKLQTRQRGEA
jgi:hypothetical protein